LSQIIIDDTSAEVIGDLIRGRLEDFQRDNAWGDLRLHVEIKSGFPATASIDEKRTYKREKTDVSARPS